MIKVEKMVHTKHKIIYHYCGAPGHIRSRRFKMLHDLRWKQAMLASVPTKVSTTPRRNQNLEWKKDQTCLLVPHHSLKAPIDHVWYLDCGCSRDMTGNAKCLFIFFMKTMLVV